MGGLPRSGSARLDKIFHFLSESLAVTLPRLFVFQWTCFMLPVFPVADGLTSLPEIVAATCTECRM